MAKKNIIETKNGSVKVKLKTPNFKVGNSSIEPASKSKVEKQEKAGVVLPKKKVVSTKDSVSSKKGSEEKKVVVKKSVTTKKVVEKKEDSVKKSTAKKTETTSKKIEPKKKVSSSSEAIKKKKEDVVKKVPAKKTETPSKKVSPKKKETTSTKVVTKKKEDSSIKSNPKLKSSTTKKSAVSKEKNTTKKTQTKKVTPVEKKSTKTAVKKQPVKKKGAAKKKKVFRLRIKNKKLLSIIGLSILVIILLVVGGYFFLFRHRNVDYLPNFDILQAVVLEDTNIVAVGSKSISSEDSVLHTEKGKIVKYDEQGNILFEVLCSKEKDSIFYSVDFHDQQYVAVGSYVSDKDSKVAYIVSYDSSGKLVWEKDYSVLTNTEFYKVLALDDGYVVVGESNGETDEKDVGGAIIVKFDFDGNILWQNHFGKNQEAEFSSVTVYQNALYAVGRSQKDTGILVKFRNNGTYVWDKTYAYTDEHGFSDIQVARNKFYIVGGKKILAEDTDESRKTSNIDAILLCYNTNGDLLYEKTFGGSNYDRYNAIESYGESIFVVGYSNSTDSGLKNFTDGKKVTGIFVKYNLNGDIEKKSVFGGSNNDNLTDIATDNSNLYIVGYTNSKDGNLLVSGENGQDYFSKLIKVDSRLRQLFIK